MTRTSMTHFLWLIWTRFRVPRKVYKFDTKYMYVYVGRLALIDLFCIWVKTRIWGRVGVAVKAWLAADELSLN